MNGIFAYVAKSDTGYQDIILQNQAGTEIISSSWPIMSPSCLRLSADGKTLLFHGMEKGRWRIYSYDISSGEVPVCLSADIAEDCKYPRFVNDNTIIFSKAGQVTILDREKGSLNTLTFDASSVNTIGEVLPDGNTCIFLSGSGASSCVMRMDINTKSSSSVKNTAGATSLEVTDNGLIVYSIPGRGICVADKLLFAGGSYITGSFGEWVIYKKGDDYEIGNIETAEYYPIAISQCDGLVYADAEVEIVKPVNGGFNRNGGDYIDSDTDRPALQGKMVYHNYTSYDAMDSRLYIYDFATNNLQDISSGWTNVRHPMNGHFSNDGQSITFMGIGTATDSWDIFVYDIGSGKQPENLTPKGNYRDEDPKFSFDGQKICFKRNGHLSEIDVATKALRILSDLENVEFGMPYYSASGDKIVFGGGSGSETFIGCWDIAASKMTKLYDKPGIVEYYPITIDEDSFYYTGHISSSNPYDQLYIGYWDGRTARYLPFNNTKADYSDACPVSHGWLILCSTRQDSLGKYDLYIANANSGAIYSLSSYNPSINTAKSELGASYSSKH